jgi:hypothetical protein
MDHQSGGEQLNGGQPNDHRPEGDFSLLEAMEVCRPGYDDLSDPALAPLAERLAASPACEDRFNRLQKLDAVLGGAFQDVAVPAGLRVRLLVVSSEAAVRQRRTAVMWMSAVAGAVAASLLLGALLLHAGRKGNYTPAMVLDEAVARFESETALPGKVVAEDSLTSSYPLSEAMRPALKVRWRKLSGFVQCGEGVAYDLVGPQGLRATLYVVAREVPNLPESPPANAVHQTGNCAAAAWQHGGLLYVLVVRGNADAYPEFLDLPHGPIA